MWSFTAPHTPTQTQTPSKVTLYHFRCQPYLLLLIKGAEPWSPRSLITVLIMLPGNNMHFISFPPSISIIHATILPSLPLPSPLLSVLFVTSSTWFFSFPPLSSTHSTLLFLARRPSVVLDLCGSQGAHEGKANAPYAWELHHAPRPARYTEISHAQEPRREEKKKRKHILMFQSTAKYFSIKAKLPCLIIETNRSGLQAFWWSIITHTGVIYSASTSTLAQQHFVPCCQAVSCLF